MNVLELLSEYPEGVALAEIARTLATPLSGTERLLGALVARDFVEEICGSRSYRLRLKLSAMGFRFLSQTGLLDICQPILDRLAAGTGEHIRMALVEDDALRWVGRAQGSRFGLHYDPDMGSPLVLHATASGRAWLATLPPEEARRIVAERGFEVPDRFGRQKIRSLDDLDIELDRTRRRGYGLTVGEIEPGSAAVAMAIDIGTSKPAPGAISVLGPITRMSPLDLEGIVEQLRIAVLQIGEAWPILEVYRSKAGF